MSKRSLYLIILFLCTSWMAVFWRPLQQGVRERPARAAALLDVQQRLRTEGTDFAFTLPEPQLAEIVVEFSPRCSSIARVTLGPLRTALRPQPVYEPDVEPEHAFEVDAGSGARVFSLKEAGPYVLRIEPIPMAMGADGEPMTVRVLVRSLLD